jgi:tRNA uridine 5-carboxymethylaminomethyl modification enzyme
MPIPFFSRRSHRSNFSQTDCHLTYTTDLTRKLIVENSHRSAMFSGRISSVGPRYCPSIEDKFFRFADKPRHQIFLEPEGNGTSEVYPNGFSTSLPEEVQRNAIRTVIGLEEAVITRPGYAVEYDYCPAFQIKPSMETRRIPGLFLAGQINGTSGYEEAAAQGLLAGINGCLYLYGEPAFVPDRSLAYIGVMIDDLATRSTTEPYRMFTSRAEYRLALREDNAQDRLAPMARKYGLIPEAEYDSIRDVQRAIENLVARMERIWIKTSELGELSQRFTKAKSVTVDKLLKLPGVDIGQVLKITSIVDRSLSDNPEVFERAAIEIRYSGYISKQQREIEKFKRMEAESIPASFKYEPLKGLKSEAKEKFIRFRPGSLGQAGRIEGITPGDVAVLSVHLKKHKETSECLRTLR